MKKTALLLAAILAVAGLSGCGGGKDKPANVSDGNFQLTGMPIVREPVTLRIVYQRDTSYRPLEELTMFLELEKRTNVKADWEMIPTVGWAEKKNLLLASGDLPDVIFNKGINDIDILANEKLFLPLEGLIEQYAPNIRRFFDETPDARAISTAPNGHIYNLPQYKPHMPETNFAMLINKAWLDKANLPVPATLEEYHTALKAFADNDMNGDGSKTDEIPLTAQWWKFDWVFPSFGMAGESGENFFLENGEMKFRPVDPRYKEAVMYLRKLYADGCIDSESFTQTLAQYNAKIKNPNKDIVGSFLSFTKDSVLSKERAENYVVIGPLEGPYGKHWNGSVYNKLARNCVEVTAANKYPEVTIRWLDELFSEDMAVQLYYGTLGEDIEKTAGGMYNILPPRDEKLDYDKSKWMNAPADAAPVGVTPDLEKRIIPTPVQKDKIDINDMYLPYLPEENLPPYMLSVEQAKEIQMINTDIMPIIDQKFAKWVVEGGIENEWDAYIDQLKKLSVDRMIELRRDALAAYQK